MAALIQYVDGIPAIKFSLDELSTYIGRASVCDIYLADKFVSKQHALIEVSDNNKVPGHKEFFIRDLDSTNHTYVNDEPVKHIRLKDKDAIRIGEEIFIFEQDENTPELAELKAFPGQEDQVEKLNSELTHSIKLNPKFSRRLKLF